MTEMCYKDHILVPGLLPEFPTVVDAGACIGEFSEWLIHSHFASSKDIYAFEANRDNVLQLRNVCTNVYNMVVGGDNLPVTTDFHIFDAKGWGSIYDKYRGRKYIRTDTVATISINKLFGFLGIDHIDYLKLDIEGAEFNLFDSMKQEVADRIYQLSCEVHFEYSDAGQYETTKYLELILRSLGFNYRWGDNKELWASRL